MPLSACAPTVDLDQPADPRSLIRDYFVRMKKISSLANLNAPSEDSEQTVQMRRLIWIR